MLLLLFGAPYAQLPLMLQDSTKPAPSCVDNTRPSGPLNYQAIWHISMCTVANQQNVDKQKAYLKEGVGGEGSHGQNWLITWILWLAPRQVLLGD